MRRLCRRLPPIFAQRLRAWLYPYERARRENLRCAVRAVTGSMLEGWTRDFHFYPFSVQGYYEWRNVAIAAALVSEGDAILEIGANVGTETVCFADLVGPAGRVHAVEPLPSNAAILRHANKLSKHGNIAVHEIALSNQTGSVEFAAPPEHHSGIGHIAAATGASPTIRVECAKLDSLIAVIGRVQLIFMDVEGEEVNVLQGGINFLREFMPPLVLEASPKLLRRAGSELGELYRMLTMLDYTVYEIARFGLKPAKPAGQTRACNWLCLGKEQNAMAGRIGRNILRAGLLPCLPGLNPIAGNR
ncbi:MAG: FkbM family methyltransferase [Gammaproteobacteria bacterium]